MAKAKKNTVSSAEIDLFKVPFRVDEGLLRRAKLEDDVAAIAVSLWRLIAKNQNVGGWERAGVQCSVRRLGN